MLLDAMMMEARKGLMGGERDQFPAGMRVLAVDDDRVCLKVLEGLLRRCQYHVTATNQAITALKLLRENKDMFDLVISDVHMPDMDGFKLLELVRHEMDLPVIMISVNGETNSVLKGITQGACDYLLKPVRIEELRNVWQHVVRKKISNLDLCRELSKQPTADLYHGLSQQVMCVSSHQGNRASKKRKEPHSEEESDEPSASKKPKRVVWSVELHRKFVAAVNQLGINKAVPKTILELMNVDKLTRDNVASHLQKYRLYLRRLNAVASQQASIAAAFGGGDPFLHLGAFEGLDGYKPFTPPADLSSFETHGLPSGAGATVFGLPDLAPSKAIQCASSNGEASHCIGDTNKFHVVNLQENQQANLAQGLTIKKPMNCLMSLGLQEKLIHHETNELSRVVSGSAVANTMSGTLQGVTSSLLHLVEGPHVKVGAHPSIRIPTASSGLLGRSAGLSANLRDSSISQPSGIPINDWFSVDNLPLHIPFDWVGATKLDANFVAPEQEMGQKGKFPGVTVFPSGSLVVANKSICGAIYSGSITMLPSDSERHSKYLNFGVASNSSHRISQDHIHNHRLNNGSFTRNGDASVREQTNAYDLGISKLQEGFNSSSCNLDGLLNSIIRVDNNEVPLTDNNDPGCELFPLGACI